MELQGDYFHYGGACKKYPPNKMQKSNMAKDARRFAFFRKLGFDVHLIWEHELLDEEAVRSKLRDLYKGD